METWPRFAHTGPLARAEIADTIALASGDLHVEFDVERVTWRTVTYRLRASNGGLKPLRCNVYTTEMKPRAKVPSKTPLLDLSVVPRELLDATVSVRKALAPTMVAEFSGPGLAVFVRAPDHELKGERLRSRGAAGASIGGGGRIALGAVAALLVAAWLVPTPLHPRVEALSVPPSVAAGADVQIAYALGGTSTGTFRLRDASGAVIDSGPVASSDGSLTIKAPTSAQAGSYSVEVSAAPQFAATAGIVPVETRSEPLTVLPGGAQVAYAQIKRIRHRKPKTPVVDSANLEKDTVESGQPIVVDYATSSTAGEVRLIDDQGTVRAEALVNHSGNSILVAPSVDVGQDFKVALDVQEGTRHEERLMPVRIEPSPGPGPTSAAASAQGATPAGDSQPAVVSAAAKNGKPFIVLQKTINEGDPIRLEIVRHHPDMRVALLDKDGNELAGMPVGPKQNAVSLETPPAAVPGSYTVDVSYRDANGQEHVIAPIAIRESQ